MRTTDSLHSALRLALGIAILASAVVSEASEAIKRTVRGEVVATNLKDSPHTIVVKVIMPNREELIVGASVPTNTGITRGKRPVGLSDIRTGEVADLIYLKNQDGLVAQSIHVR